MNTFIKPPHASIWLSAEAVSLSSKLIVNLQIQQGSQLAKMLGVSPIFYNDEAVRIWVQRELNEGLTLNLDSLTNLETKFLAIMNHYEIHYSL